MTKRASGISYRNASAGSSRGISAGQWNGFLGMHKDFYNSIIGSTPLPPLLRGSTTAMATLKEYSDDIGAFQPVRIVKNVEFRNIISKTPSYIVEPVDEWYLDTDRHANYGFTLGEGVTANSGGRIVIAGIAIVAVEAQDLYYNSEESVRDGSFDSMYYMVPDRTLSSDLDVIAPVGHFKIVSTYDVSDVGSYEADAALFIAVDMSQRPTSFLANVGTTIPAATESSGVTTMSSHIAYAYYGVVDSTAHRDEVDVKKDEDAYAIEVYNTSGEAIPSGQHLVTYSLEYNRFIVLVASGQTVKIGKTNSLISVGSTGTVSIWRDGVETIENETVSLDWMAGTTDVSAGKEVMITWFADEGIWRITGAECED